MRQNLSPLLVIVVVNESLQDSTHEFRSAYSFIATDVVNLKLLVRSEAQCHATILVNGCVLDKLFLSHIYILYTKVRKIFHNSKYINKLILFS